MVKKAKRSRNGVNKSEFIRARPTASIDEVIDAAKKEGITITRDAVHKARWQVKTHEALHPKKSRQVVNGTSLVHVKSPDAKTSSRFKTPPVKNGNGISLEADLKDLDAAAEAVLGSSIAKAMQAIVRKEVRAEVRRIMGAGIDA